MKLLYIYDHPHKKIFISPKERVGGKGGTWTQSKGKNEIAEKKYNFLLGICAIEACELSCAITRDSEKNSSQLNFPSIHPVWLKLVRMHFLWIYLFLLWYLYKNRRPPFDTHSTIKLKTEFMAKRLCSMLLDTRGYQRKTQQK